MTRFTFKLPDIGEGISEAEIVAWHVAVGDRVEEDQQLADMMTDKATVEMESPVAGTIVELAGEVGDQVSIGAALVVIETDADEGAPAEETKADEVEEQFEAETPGMEATLSPSPLVGEGRGPSQSDGKGEGDTRSSPEPHPPHPSVASLLPPSPTGEEGFRVDPHSTSRLIQITIFFTRRREGAKRDPARFSLRISPTRMGTAPTSHKPLRVFASSRESTSRQTECGSPLIC